MCDDCLFHQVTSLEAESTCALHGCDFTTTKLSLVWEENTMVSASSGCQAGEMMPKCLLTEVSLGVRLAHKGHLSSQYNSV